MSNPVWKGILGYGEVSFAVRLYSAARAKTVSFCQLDPADNSPVRQELVREVDGKPVSRDALVKGYEIEKGRYLAFTDEEIAAAHPPAPKLIEISSFAGSAEIDPLWLESSYYIAPDADCELPYAALLVALRKTDTVAVTRITVSTRERPAIIRAGGSGLILHTLFYAHELRRLDEFRTNTAGVTDEFRLTAQRAVKRLRQRFSMDAMNDRQHEHLVAIIEVKAQRKHPQKRHC